MDGMTNEQLRAMSDGLRYIAKRYRPDNAIGLSPCDCDDLESAADALDALAAENAKLRGEVDQLKAYTDFMQSYGHPTSLMVDGGDYPMAYELWYIALDKIAVENIGESVSEIVDGMEELVGPEKAIRVLMDRMKEQHAEEVGKLRGEVEAERNHKVYLAAIMRRYLQWDSNKSPYTREYCLDKVWTHIRAIEAEDARSQTPNGGEVAK